MKKMALGVAFALIIALPARGATPAAPAAWPDVTIPYEKFVLPNGLTLIVHEDHKAPIVAVNIYYHVGSKDERPGRTGFAHLFEHLMFNGSEHANDEYFRVLDAVGATKLNGTTWFDRTNYYQNVPSSALDVVLWMESDRMGHLLGVIDQAKLDEQRGVVQNEKRQGENRPYGKVDDVITASTYPAGHPYSWTTIGSMEDLNAASLEDVKEWFRTWYGAGNAVLTIAGDVTVAQAKEKVAQYFGDIPGGPALKRQESWVAKMSGEKRAFLQDRVPQAQINKVWNVPGFSSHEAALLDLAAQVLGGGKSSRLYKRLVYTDRSATSASAGVAPFELGGQFRISATVVPGGDVRAVERAVDQELARLLRDGPSAEELERIKLDNYASFVRSVERIDGEGGKSTILAEGQVYAGSADFYKQSLRWLREATPAEVRRVARQWLSDGVFVLEVQPIPEYTTTASTVDRSKVPAAGVPQPLSLPKLQRTTLSNGLKVVLAERHNAPIVEINMLFDAGNALDARTKPGTVGMTLTMLDEGTRTRSSLQIAALAERLGAQLRAGSTADTSFVGLSALTAKLPESLELFSDVLLNPTFPEPDLERLKAQYTARIKQSKSEPRGVAQRLFPPLVYGTGHPYAATATVSEQGIATLTSGELRAFYRRWLRPDNAVLLIVGDTSLDKIKPLLEQRLASWKAPADALQKAVVPAVGRQTQPRVFLVNRTGAEQSTIVAGYIGPTRADPDFIALDTVNTVLGGSFLSRINMNLREDKHWSYGAGSYLSESRGPGLFLISAPVQTDKTAESMREVQKELQDLTGSRPPTDKEIAAAKSTLVLTLPGNNETAEEVARSYANILAFGLADTYWNDYVGAVNDLTPAQLNAAAAKLVDPKALTWIVVGDLAKIEDKVRALKLGEVKVLDPDGKVVRWP